MRLLFMLAVPLVAALGSGPAAAQGGSVYEYGVPPGYVGVPPSFACTATETVLLIQNNVPWFAPAGDDPLGANVTELLAQGKNFCVATAPDAVAKSAAELSQFAEILISAAQTQEFYDTLFPGGTILVNLSDYVNAGGFLKANLADHASGPGAGGNWDGDTFVGGVEHVFVATEDNNNIADASDRIVSDALPCPSANCGALVDTADFIDLDGWGLSSHGFFTDTPAGTTVILVDSSSRPVSIRYPFGSGLVHANLNTGEFRYVGGFDDSIVPINKKLLANEIADQAGDALVVEAPAGTAAVLSGAGFVTVQGGTVEPPTGSTVEETFFVPGAFIRLCDETIVLNPCNFHPENPANEDLAGPPDVTTFTHSGTTSCVLICDFNFGGTPTCFNVCSPLF